jgi:hypothetical protein
VQPGLRTHDLGNHHLKKKIKLKVAHCCSGAAFLKEKVSDGPSKLLVKNIDCWSPYPIPSGIYPVLVSCPCDKIPEIIYIEEIITLFHTFRSFCPWSLVPGVFGAVVSCTPLRTCGGRKLSASW